MSQQLKEEIRRGFAGLEEPLAGLLDMLEGSSDWRGKGHCLGYYITTELELWMKECPAVQQVRRRESRAAGREERTDDFRVPQACPFSLCSLGQRLAVGSYKRGVTRCEICSG